LYHEIYPKKNFHQAPNAADFPKAPGQRSGTLASCSTTGKDFAFGISAPGDQRSGEEGLARRSELAAKAITFMIRSHPDTDSMTTAEISTAIAEAHENLRLAKEIHDKQAAVQLAWNCQLISRSFGRDATNGLYARLAFATKTKSFTTSRGFICPS